MAMWPQLRNITVFFKYQCDRILEKFYIKTVNVLELQQRDLNDVYTEYIAQILIDNTVSFLFILLFLLYFSQFHLQQIKSLYLDNNRISNEGVKYLAEMLKINRVKRFVIQIFVSFI